MTRAIKWLVPPRSNVKLSRAEQESMKHTPEMYKIQLDIKQMGDFKTQHTIDCSDQQNNFRDQGEVGTVKRSANRRRTKKTVYRSKHKLINQIQVNKSHLHYNEVIIIYFEQYLFIKKGKLFLTAGRMGVGEKATMSSQCYYWMLHLQGQCYPNYLFITPTSSPINILWGVIHTQQWHLPVATKWIF